MNALGSHHRGRATRIMALALVFCGLLAAHRAQAGMHFLHPNGRPAGILVTSSNVLRVHALAGYNETKNFLAWKTLSTDWTNIANPAGVTSFYMLSSVAGVNAPSFGGPRVFVVSQTDSAGCQLWEYYYDSLGNGTWQALGVPSGGGVTANMCNAPYITSALDAADGSVWVGVRTANNGTGNDGHLWSCHIMSSTGSCSWEDETCRGTHGCNVASTNSAMAEDSYTTPGSAEREFYIVDASGNIRRYRWSLGDWDTLPLFSSSPIDTAALQVWNDGTHITVAAGVINTGTGLDRLELLTTTTTGTTWTPYVPAGGPPYLPSANNLAVGVTSGAGTAYIATPTNVWGCSWSGTTCTWANAGHPPDQLGSQNIGGGSWAQNATSVFFTGSLGGAEYLFQYGAIGAQGANQWANHLAPHDSGGPGALPYRNIGEYDSDEYGGTVVFTASGINSPDFPNSCEVGVWRSTDDWNTYSAVAYPFGGISPGYCGDQTVSFDSAGTAFIASTTPFSSNPYSIEIVRWDSTAGNWTTAYPIPPTMGATWDRPVLLADRLTPNVLYLVWSAGAASNGGRLAYCPGGAGHCTADPNGWCSSYVYTLPSMTGCAASSRADGSPGCWIDQSGDGTVYLAIQDDNQCTPRTNYNVIGIRHIMNRSSLILGCTTINVSQTPSCIYFVKKPLTYQENGPVVQPGNADRWSARLHGSRDNTSRVSIELQSYTDSDTGLICTSTSMKCRSEQYFAYYRDPTNGWCGASCNTAPDPSTMLLVNRDQAGPPFRQVDHIESGVAALDYGQWGITWLDFRTDYMNDNAFNFGTSLVAMNPSTYLATSSEQGFWPSTTGSYSRYIAGSTSIETWYGDENRHSNGRGHAHFFDEYSSSGTGQYTEAFYVTWSPSAPATGH